MTIELQIISITVRDGDIQENFTGILPVCQPYLPAPKTPKRRRPKKKTVAHLIDALIDDIDKME